MLLNFFMNSASDVAYLLLTAHNHNHTEAYFGFTKFVIMSWRISITVVSMWSFFHYNPNFYYYESYNLIKTNTLVFIYFQWHLKLVLDDTMDEESKKISKSESLPTGCCLAFARFLASFSLALLVKVLLIKKRSVYTYMRKGMLIYTNMLLCLKCFNSENIYVGTFFENV